MICLRAMIGTQTQANRRAYIALLVFLCVFVGFRYETGTDWPAYREMFNSHEQYSYAEVITKADPGFGILCKALNSAGYTYHAMNLCASSIFFAGLHVLARRQNDPLGFLVLTFPILIINMPMAGIRQAMGIGMMCVAFCAFNDRRIGMFVFMTVFASLFHSSARVFLLLAPLVTGQYSNRRLLLAGFLALPGLYALSVSSAAEVLIARYVKETAPQASGAIYRTLLLFFTGVWFVFYGRKPWNRTFPYDYKLVLLGSLLILTLLPMIMVSTVVADRFGYYLIPIQTMIFARLPFLMKKSAHSQLMSLTPYIGLFIFFATWTHLSWIFDVAYNPYQSWLMDF